MDPRKRPLFLLHQHLESLTDEDMAAMDKVVEELRNDPNGDQKRVAWIQDGDPFGGNWEWLHDEDRKWENADAM